MRRLFERRVPTVKNSDDSTSETETKEVAGTMPSGGGSVSLSHGLEMADIVEVSVIATNGTERYTPLSGLLSSSRSFAWKITSTAIVVTAGSLLSSSIAGKTVTAIIRYRV